MCMIDTDFWNLTLPSHSIRADNSWSFNGSAIDMLSHLAVNWDEATLFQTSIDDFLEADLVYKNWKQINPKIGEQPQFRKYRKSQQSKKIHSITDCIYTSGSVVDKERALVEALLKEISLSPICLERGQVIFHGAAIDLCGIDLPFVYKPKKFLSCSLSPHIAAWHAITSGSKSKNAVALIIHLDIDTPAIFGVKKGGHLNHEHEFLLKCGANLEIREIYDVKGCFKIAEATLVDFEPLPAAL